MVETNNVLELDILDKVKNKLTPELVNIIIKYIVLPDNLEIIRKQKKQKHYMHKELLYKMFIKEIKGFLLLNILNNIYGNNDANNITINITDINIIEYGNLIEDGNLIVNFLYY